MNAPVVSPVPAVTWREVVAQLPIVILARAVAQAFGGDAPRGYAPAPAFRG